MVTIPSVNDIYEETMSNRYVANAVLNKFGRLTDSLVNKIKNAASKGEFYINTEYNALDYGVWAVEDYRWIKWKLKTIFEGYNVEVKYRHMDNKLFITIKWGIDNLL